MTRCFTLPLRMISIGLLGSLISGCAPDIENLFACPLPENKPILISREAYNAQLQVLDSQPIIQNGKILTYKNYLLIDEPKKGIHLFDNSDPSVPVGLKFITIPNYTSSFIRNDILYIVAHGDFIQLDLSDINNIHEIKRQPNLLREFNIYRFGFFNIEKFPVDSENEMVIGVESYIEPAEGCGEDVLDQDSAIQDGSSQDSSNQDSSNQDSSSQDSSNQDSSNQDSSDQDAASAQSITSVIN